MTPNSSKMIAAVCAAAIAASPQAAAHNNNDAIPAKPGSNISTLKPPIIAAQPALESAWEYCGVGKPYITSGNDSHHRKGSWHYKSLGIDLRSRGMTERQISCLLTEVPKRLPKAAGGRYVFIFEPNGKSVTEHFHFHFNDGSA